ncbi:MAG: 4Fe-4S dicluster domain-containing protein [Candidatus Zixiibacteriota bacterium]
MARWGMTIDLDRCTGCQACTQACVQENNLPFGNLEQSKMRRSISWMQVLPMPSEESEEADGAASLVPILCQHCDEPPCTAVCPVSATYKNDEGIVAQIYPRCIGCRYCANACPYTVKYFNWLAPEWPEEMKSMHNPDVSVRPVGVIEKCTFCHHRLIVAREKAKDEDREMDASEYVPACVQSCPADAITFGDLDHEHSDVKKKASDPRSFQLMGDLGTRPKVFYLRRVD